VRQRGPVNMGRIMHLPTTRLNPLAPGARPL
jgi:hypothetical protein